MYGILRLLRRLPVGRILRWGACVAVGGGCAFLLGGCASLTGEANGQPAEPYEVSLRLRAGPPQARSQRSPVIVCTAGGQCSELVNPAPIGAK